MGLRKGGLEGERNEFGGKEGEGDRREKDEG